MQKLEDIRFVSELTGLSVSTLYKMTAKDEIPVVRFGRKVMFRPEDVETFVNQRLSNLERTGDKPGEETKSPVPTETQPSR